MDLYQEIKIFTGLGQPDPDYVSEQLKQCRSGIERYDSEIARRTAESERMMRTHASFVSISTVISDESFNGWMIIYAKRDCAVAGRKKAQGRLAKLERIASKF